MGEIKKYLNRMPKRAVITIAVAVVLLLLFVLYQRNSANSNGIKTLVRPDFSEEIFVDDFSKLGQSIQEQKEKTLPGDSVLELKLKEDSGIIKRSIHITEVFEKISPQIPRELIDSLDTRFIFALYFHRNPETKNFFVLAEVKKFEQAFSAMRVWEKDIYNDLSEILGYDPRPVLSQPFRTTSIRNQNVRALVSGEETLLLYSFLDNETLFIGTDPETFRKVLDIFIVSKLR